MKRRHWWWLLIVGLIFAAGCAPQKQADTHSIKQSTQQKKNDSSQAKSKKAKASTSQSSRADNWNATKQADLSTFMKKWQTAMGQQYQGTYDGQKPNHLGFIFPDTLQNGNLVERLSLYHEKVQLEWSTDGAKEAGIQVVAVATGGKPQAMYPTTYFFCFYEGRPVVFVTQTTNGNILYLSDTQNAELQAGFAQIVTGKSPTMLSDADLNNAVAGSLSANPPQLPKAYQGTWYTYNKTSQTVQPFTLDAGGKLLYADDMTPKWVHIFGQNQTAGAGDYYYVRYRFFLGRQIPVMMRGYGAGAWFSDNAYQKESQAAVMQDWQFGDEPKTQ
jgi:hypothetical protein